MSIFCTEVAIWRYPCFVFEQSVVEVEIIDEVFQTDRACKHSSSSWTVKLASW
jgi:hypothetical protein